MDATTHLPFRSGTAARRVAHLFALLLLTVLPARAALQFDVFLGYDGYLPEAGWFPVVCELYNDGPTFTGVIEVGGDGLARAGFERLTKVELPTGTRKIVTLPAFNPTTYPSPWRVQLKDTAGRLREDRPGLQPRGVVRRMSVLLGSLPRVAGWAPVILAPQVRNSDLQPAVARFQPGTFPDNAIVLEGLNALYLNSERAADLRAGQVAALQTWLRTGGHLIVGVESPGDVTALPWLRALVPGDVTGATRVAPGNAFEEWLRSPVPQVRPTPPPPAAHKSNKQTNADPRITLERPFGNVADNDRIGAAELSVATGAVRRGERMVTANGQPLIVSAPLGNGRVTVLLFSPEREPFKSWRNQPAFWARLTGVPAELYLNKDYYSYGGWGLDGVFGAMIDSRQVRKLPVFWLLLMLLAYLAVIGPLDHLWLKKIKRPMLTWLTFPVYVALFSGLIYLVGYKLRAGETEWNELHVVDVLGTAGDTAPMRGRTYASLYSPVNARYQLAAQAQAAAFRGEFSGSWAAGNDAAERGQVVQTDMRFEADVFAPVWTSQLYVNEWLQTNRAPFTARLAHGPKGWTLNLQNHLAQPLTNLRLALQTAPGQLRLVPLEDIPGGQTRDLIVNTDQATPLADFVAQQADRFQSAVSQRRQAFGAMEGGRIQDAAAASMAASFLELYAARQAYQNFTLPAAFDLTGSVDAHRAVLLAWTPGHAAAPPMNRFKPLRRAENTLWRQTLPLTPTP